MTSPVILNPDRFAEQFSEGQLLGYGVGSRAGRPGLTRWPHRAPDAQMCGECIRGKHNLCEKPETCSCVHRDEPPVCSTLR
jgi:hypothetical protein